MDTKRLKIFALTYSWTLAVSLLLQLYVFPNFYGSAYWGHGLTNGDWVVFHENAVRFAQTSTAFNWNFSVAPLELFPSYPLGIVYLLTGIHEPWVFLPINSLAVALSCVCIYETFVRIGLNKSGSHFAALAYGFAPSGVEMYSQIHRDIFIFLAFHIFLLACLDTLIRPNRNITVGACIGFVAALTVAAFFRPYLLYVFGICLLVLIVMTVFINRKSVQKVLPKIFFCALMCVISIGVAKNIGQIANFSAQAAKAPKVGYKPANAFDMLFPEVIRDQFRAIQIARTAFSLNTLGDPAYYKNNAYTDLVLDTPSNYLRSTPKLTFIALFEPANYILSKKANLSLYDALTSIEGLVGACFVLFAIFASIRSSSPSLILIVIISVILLLIATSVSVNMVTYRRMKMGYFTSLSSMGFALAWSQLTVSGWKAYFADRKKAV